MGAVPKVQDVRSEGEGCFLHSWHVLVCDRSYGSRIMAKNVLGFRQVEFDGTRGQPSQYTQLPVGLKLIGKQKNSGRNTSLLAPNNRVYFMDLLDNAFYFYLLKGHIRSYSTFQQMVVSIRVKTFDWFFSIHKPGNNSIGRTKHFEHKNLLFSFL